MMAAMDTIRSSFGVSSYLTKVDTFIGGAELEIEDVKDIKGAIPWNVEADGSLRNNGREFISPPLNINELINGFRSVHKSLVFSSGEKRAPFSDRTSIHVHVNCLDCTQEQVKSMVLWYALYEPVFFALVDERRKNNIHCVALTQTVVSENYRRTLPIMVNKWSKYTALNILPLKTQGTIEFRHMEGHDDCDRFADWLATIESLWAHGKQVKFDKAALMEDNYLLKNFDKIFGKVSAKKFRPYLTEMVENNVMDVKLALV